MTGPAYPPQPADLGGSNAIGTFVIGRSQIGTIPAYDIWRTIMSQYANSPVITSLIHNFFDCFDQTKNMDDFFDLIWNVDTAQGYGLDVWGRIVAVNRVLTIGAGPPYFGWDEGLDYEDFAPGGLGPFYSGQKLTDNYILTDDGFRVLILAKAFSNICDGSIKSINRLLRMLFPTKKGYVRDNLDMTFDYVFDQKLTPLQVSILTSSGVFPRPVGVSYTVAEL